MNKKDCNFRQSIINIIQMILYRYERKGILLLLLLITGLVVLPRQFLRQHTELVCVAEEIPADTVGSPTPTSNSRPLELNGADSLSLIKIKGIGPYYASRIISYRKRLGGFYSVMQLKDLNMKHFHIDSTAHLFSADKRKITKRELDTMSFKAILSHPYLEYEEVRQIFDAKRKYRKISMDTLIHKKVLPVYKLEKLKPYFK